MELVLNKQKMAFRDYIAVTEALSWDLYEEEDYIVFNDRKGSHLELLIEKTAFFKIPFYRYKKNAVYHDYVFFDMLKMWYPFPFAPWMDAISVRFGDYIEDDAERPRFLLKEPKFAKHLLIYNTQHFLFYGDDLGLIKYSYQPDGIVVVPTNTKFSWKAKGILHLSVDKNDEDVKHFVEESQRWFEKKLLEFYIYETKN